MIMKTIFDSHGLKTVSSLLRKIAAAVRHRHAWTEKNLLVVRGVKLNVADVILLL